MNPWAFFGVIGGVALIGVVAFMGGDEQTQDHESPEGDQGVRMARSGTPGEKPGKNFTWAEFERTGTGLPNQAPDSARLAIQQLVGEVLDPLREAIKRPVRITSGFRSAEVNASLPGAATTSRHLTGEAADIKVDGVDAETLASTIRALGLPIDQVIWYHPSKGGHVHLQIRDDAPRRGEFRYQPASGKSYPADPRTTPLASAPVA